MLNVPELKQSKPCAKESHSERTDESESQVNDKKKNKKPTRPITKINTAEETTWGFLCKLRPSATRRYPAAIVATAQAARITLPPHSEGGLPLQK